MAPDRNHGKQHILFFFPVIAGFASAVLGDRKNRGGTSWGAVSFILPVLVFVIVFLPALGEEKGETKSRNPLKVSSGIALGLFFMLTGFSLMLAEENVRFDAVILSFGLGAFVIWRSVRRSGERPA
ncbi:MAG: hypothetical protein V3R66_07415 [Rhodospirillales bacterium]